MKKLFALLVVCGFALAFTACGSKPAETPAAEETAAPAEETPAVEEAPADTTAAPADSTAAE
jgi:predicted small lipoprotein YifL